MDRPFDDIPEIDVADDRKPWVASVVLVDDRPPAFTDEALALRFAERHEADLRYVAPGGGGSTVTGSVGDSTTLSSRSI